MMNQRTDKRTGFRADRPCALFKGTAAFFLVSAMLFHVFFAAVPYVAGTAFVQAGTMDPLSLEERYIVRFSDSVPLEEIQRLLSPYPHECIGSASLKLFTVGTDLPDRLQAALRGKTDYIEKDSAIQLQEDPNDPLFPEQWALTAVHMIDSWPDAVDFSSVTVAVIDSGVDRTHPDLVGVNIEDGRDFTAETSGTIVTGDLIGHGTKTTGIIAAASNNAVGISGACPNVNILPLNVFGASLYASTSDVCAAIRYAADAGADVINMSLGTDTYSDAMADAAAYAASKGCILVASAGNKGISSKNYPASYDGVISVASINSSLSISSFSNYNDAVDVAAPGEEVLTTSCYAIDHVYYKTVNGTSFSAPYVSAIAASARVHDDTIDTFEFHELLKDTSIDAGTAGYDDHFGYGIINAAGLMAYLQGVATSGYFTYRLTGTDAEIIGYSGPGEAVTIPDTLDGYPVTGIGDAAFANAAGLTSIVIPDPVATVGDGAFENCTNLAAAYFMGDAPLMGNAVFGNCAGSFTVYYRAESTGFTTPEWNTYPTATFNHYTVTFVDHDGTTILKTEEVPEGRAATAPEDPLRVGYTFTGWDAAFDNITGDLTVTALYAINQYTVAFDSRGGSSVPSVQADYGTFIAAPSAPARIGYTFAGWYRSVLYETAWSFSEDTVTGDRTLYAKWTVIRGDITADGSIDVLDLLKLKKHLLGQVALTGDAALAADVTSDGNLDVLDLLKIKKYLLGQIVF